MSGTIKSLDVGSASGVITAEGGLSVGFSPSAVPANDVPSLTLGQVVSFDLEDGEHPTALNVVLVQREPEAVNGRDKRLEITRLRYLGFEHKGNVRAYMFEEIAPGMEKRTFTVNADLTLFTRHHVGMQEGPALCLHLLAAELDVAGAAAGTAVQCSLSDREMLAYLSSRPARRNRLGSKRALAASASDSHVL